jgi:hypothetical protein
VIGCPCGASIPRTRHAAHATVCALQQLRRRQEATVHAEMTRREAR